MSVALQSIHRPASFAYAPCPCLLPSWLLEASNRSIFPAKRGLRSACQEVPTTGQRCFNGGSPSEFYRTKLPTRERELRVYHSVRPQQALESDSSERWRCLPNLASKNLVMTAGEAKGTFSKRRSSRQLFRQQRA